MKKKVLITGALGQDGTLLTELLLDEFIIFGVCKPDTDNNRINLHKSNYNIELYSIDLTNYNETYDLINTLKPDIIVNFAGVTDVMNPWEDIDNTYKQNCQIPSNILKSISKVDNKIYFFQSSSSLMFARSNQNEINENSALSPMFPYGVTKTYSHNLLNEYRIKYGIRGCSGIFFNHESPQRSDIFLSKKLAKFISKILKGENIKLNLFDLNNYRDISHAKDFMRGVKLIITSQVDDDFIFSSGKLTNLLEFTTQYFKQFNLEINQLVNYVDNNKSPDYKIYGDNSKLKSLGWEPEYTIESLINEMVNNEINS
jgi:GDPmannose 4,6-dehydratase